MILLLCALFIAHYFKDQIVKFPTRIKRNIYQDYATLITPNLTLPEFMSHSLLQPKSTKWNNILFILLPVDTFLLQSLPIPLILISWILIYLSFLDIHYYLTDIYGLTAIFILALINVLYYDVQNINEKLFTLFSILLFFILFIPIMAFFFKKEGLGLGDVGLFIVLALLFDLEKMWLMLILASLLGLLFALCYFGIYRKKIAILPFIPFIMLSTFLLFIDKMGYLNFSFK